MGFDDPTNIVTELFCPRCGGRAVSASFCPLDGSSMLPVGKDDDLSGTVLKNKYILIEKLGKGAFGTVYKAFHKIAKVEMAIKVINPQVQDDPKARRSFLKEAQAVLRIQSPHAVLVHDIDEDDEGRLFIVMELLKGVDLSTYVKQRSKEGRLPPEEVIRIAREVCLGLDDAHAKGVVHRDLKPNNVMMVEGKRGKTIAKVVDFGIARLQRLSSLDMTTQDTLNVVVGTPSYMSPEQCRGKPVDGRSDLYGLGVMMYELITGKRPFNQDTVQGIMIAHVTEEPPPISKVSPDVNIPAPLERLVMRLLEKDPNKRPKDASEVIKILDSISLYSHKSPLALILVASIVVTLMVCLAIALIVFKNNKDENLVVNQPDNSSVLSREDILDMEKQATLLEEIQIVNRFIKEDIQEPEKIPQIRTHKQRLTTGGEKRLIIRKEEKSGIKNESVAETEIRTTDEVKKEKNRIIGPRKPRKPGVDSD